ncbi:MAG: hypothetical protein RJA36_2595 [Pseudomonadota bacterium]|jgi:serine/threonine protein phosphatase PrpC
MKFSVYQVSHKGGRALNEDRLGYSYTRDAALLVLADGMGGHPDGEKAAELAVQTFNQRFLAAARPALADVPDFLVHTLHAANQVIVDYAASQGLSDNPRTTLVAALLQGGWLHAIHVGDSRLYWVRAGRLLERTRDHSWREQAGLLRSVPQRLDRSLLFTSLGSPTPPLYDLGRPAHLCEGDRLLLCSDGLWSVLDDGDIAARLGAGPLERAVPGLAELALERGGRHGDNVSLLALQWETPDACASGQPAPDA